MMNMYEAMSGWMGGWMGAWMWIPSVILIVLLVLLAVTLIRFMSTASMHGADEPLAIAGRRLARGEISKDEFEQLRAALGGS